MPMRTTRVPARSGNGNGSARRRPDTRATDRVLEIAGGERCQLFLEAFDRIVTEVDPVREGDRRRLVGDGPGEPLVAVTQACRHRAGAGAQVAMAPIVDEPPDPVAGHDLRQSTVWWGHDMVTGHDRPIGCVG